MSGSFFKKAMNRFVEANQVRAQRYVDGALLSLDDKTLAQLGTSHAELRRRGARASYF